MEKSNRNKKTEPLSILDHPTKPMSKKNLNIYLDKLMKSKMVSPNDLVPIIKNMIEPQFSFAPSKFIVTGDNGEKNTIYLCWCGKFETGHFMFYREETDLCSKTNKVLYNGFLFEMTKDPERICEILQKFISSFPKHLRTVGTNPAIEMVALFVQRTLTLNQNLLLPVISAQNMNTNTKDILEENRIAKTPFWSWDKILKYGPLVAIGIYFLIQIIK